MQLSGLLQPSESISPGQFTKSPGRRVQSNGHQVGQLPPALGIHVTEKHPLASNELQETSVGSQITGQLIGHMVPSSPTTPWSGFSQKRYLGQPSSPLPTGQAISFSPHSRQAAETVAIKQANNMKTFMLKGWI